MNSEFLKQLIQLLAQHGGTFTCPLADLQQVGLELSLQNISSDNSAMLTLRLGARIYYVPAATAAAQANAAQAAQEEPWTATETSENPLRNTSSPGRTLVTVPDEIRAVKSLNNHPPPPPPATETYESPQSPSTGADTPLNRPVTKDDLSLYLLEQRASHAKLARGEREAREAERRGRQFPWETRKPH